MVPQASLAPAQAPLARGALSERLVPPFLQSVHFLTPDVPSPIHRGNKKRRWENPKRRQMKAGEGARTLDIHVGNVTLYH